MISVIFRAAASETVIDAVVGALHIESLLALTVIDDDLSIDRGIPEAFVIAASKLKLISLSVLYPRWTSTAKIFFPILSLGWSI